MKHNLLHRALPLLTACTVLTSVCALPAGAAETDSAAPGVVNTSQDGGANLVSLTEERTFTARIPVSMTLEEAQQAAQTALWSVVRDESRPYVDQALFPNQSQGGEMSGWTCKDGETPFFTGLSASAVESDGQVYLELSFSNQCYFLDDPSVPHTNGGYYIDVCGFFDLTATLDGKTLGSTPLTILPYDGFHTMEEIYAEMDEMVDYAAKNTSLYVEEFSMGMSQGDNGLEPLNMPYLVVAKSKAAVEKWKSIQAQAESDPTALIEQIENGSLGDYQVPVLYSNVHANEVSASDGIIAFTWMLLEAAASEDKTIDYDRLTGFTAAGEAELAAQMGQVGAEGSVAVPDLVKDTATYLGYLKGENPDGSTASVSTVVDLEEYYTIATETVNVDELLDDVFFLIVPEENVEGRTYLTRTSSGGFDLNRDNSFQTQAETQNMTRLIGQWNPVSFAEFHGRVETFQCEPCDPPHEPNFEYDLLSQHLMTGGEALGIAAVANNEGYNSYVIPQRDYLTYTGEKTADGQDQTQWLEPWDDMSTSYTPQYAMLHGTVAYTVEVPAYNQHTAQALAYGQLGQSAYIAENKDSYLLNQTKIFERGVTNANSNAYDLVGQWFTDQYDVEGAEADLFRPEYDGAGENGNFYPECYIIPMDGELQHNLDAAAEMMEYLTRNDVIVHLTTDAFPFDGVTYPAGTMVVSMYQAKRSVANGTLYDGTVITEWPVLYSEGITAFDKTRGFDMAVCAQPAAYAEISAVLGEGMDYADAQKFLSTFTSSFRGSTDGQVILVNASEDSTAAVNQLLRAGKAVSLITEGDYTGSFLCSYADWLTVAGDYRLTGIGITEPPAATPLTKAPVLYISGKPANSTSGFVYAPLTSGSYAYNYDRQALESLGFTVTDNPAQADLILGATALNGAALAAVKNGTPYLGYGSSAVSGAAQLFAEGALVRQTAAPQALDALAYVTYPTESLVTASYVAEGDDLLYGYGAGYFQTIPQGAQVLVQLDGSKELLEGFLPSTGAHYHDFLNNSIQAIAYEGQGAEGANLDVVLFANTLTNKTHQRDEYNFISNMAFAQVLEGSQSNAGASFTDVADNHWFAPYVEQVVELGLMSGVSDTTFAPNATTTRGMLVTVLHSLAGKPAAADAGFVDVKAGEWYAAAANWAYQSGITAGTTDTTFSPNAPLTREQTVTMLAAYAKAQGLEVAAQSDLSGCPDAGSISGYALLPMTWAVEQGLLTGNERDELMPQGTTSRAQLATMLVQAVALFQ